MQNYIYCLALGHNHSLCKAEILNVLVSRYIDFEVLEASAEGLIIKTDQDIRNLVAIDDFGSIAKVIEIFRIISLDEFLSKRLEGQVDGEFFEYYGGENPANIKVFGLSVYGTGCRYKDLNQSWYVAPSVCQKVRDEWTSYGHKIGFLPLKARIVPSASVDNNKLLSRGFELVTAIGKDKVYVGKTISIQDYKSYSFRDYERPSRDAKSGMIPPKLAKMMINLANKEKDQVILDPFCGSGTILQEAILLGYEKVVGSDLSPEAVAGAKDNLAWLFKNYKIDEKKQKVEIFQQDVRTLSVKFPKKDIDAIVTEPYLGSPRVRGFSINQIKSEISKLETLYLGALGEFQRIINRYGIIVIILPVFKYRNDFLHLEILDKIDRTGWVINSFVPEKYRNEATLKLLNLEISKRGSIVYYRPDQTVSREIFIFSKR